MLGGTLLSRHGAANKERLSGAYLKPVNAVIEVVCLVMWCSNPQLTSPMPRGIPTCCHLAGPLCLPTSCASPTTSYWKKLRKQRAAHALYFSPQQGTAAAYAL